jgi:hypothetical protein
MLFYHLLLKLGKRFKTLRWFNGLRVKVGAFCSKGSMGSIGSRGSRGWGFRKVGAAFPYFLFLVSYSLFP